MTKRHDSGWIADVSCLPALDDVCVVGRLLDLRFDGFAPSPTGTSKDTATGSPGQRSARSSPTASPTVSPTVVSPTVVSSKVVSSKVVSPTGGQAILALEDLSGRLWARVREGGRLPDALGTQSARASLPSIEALASLPMGAWIRASGHWDGTCLHASTWEVLTRPRRVFPSGQSDWWQMRQGPLSPFEAMSRWQQAKAETRAFFLARAYVEVETPTLLDAPALDPHVALFSVTGEAAGAGVRPESEPAKPTGWLRTSPEFHHKRLLAAGAKRIFELGRCFRDDPHGPHHHREFAMLEWYQVGLDGAGMRAETEALVMHLHARSRGAKGWTTPWPEHTVEALLHACAGVALDTLDEDAFYRAWVESVDPWLSTQRSPCFVTEWPLFAASLAAPCTHRADRADRFELYAEGIELSNGFAELTDPEEQHRRFRCDQHARAARGLPVPPIDEAFLTALRDGLPPCAGNALGLDRLIMLLAGLPSIDALHPLASRDESLRSR